MKITKLWPFNYLAAQVPLSMFKPPPQRLDQMSSQRFEAKYFIVGTMGTGQYGAVYKVQRRNMSPACKGESTLFEKFSGFILTKFDYTFSFGSQSPKY